MFMKALFRLFACEYGPAIPAAFLRQSMLACIALYLPSLTWQDRITKAEYHRKQAWRMLCQKLMTKPLDTSLTEQEAFAVFVLQYSVWSTTDGDLYFVQQANELLLRAKSTSTNNRPVSERLLNLFLPFIIDNSALHEMLLLCNKVRPQTCLFRPLATVTDLVVAYTQLSTLVSPSLSALLMAVIYTVERCSLRLVCCLMRVAISQLSISVDDPYEDIYIKRAILDIQHVLDDSNFKSGTSELLSNWGNSPESTESETAAYCSRWLDIIEYVLVLLKAPTILEGLTTPNVLSMGRSLFFSFRSYSLGNPSREFLTGLDYEMAIVLTSFSLSSEEFEACISITRCLC